MIINKLQISIYTIHGIDFAIYLLYLYHTWNRFRHFLE
nr:MAG: hypothetical protein [Prevotella phage R001]